jgi:hypothetical protein
MWLGGQPVYLTKAYFGPWPVIFGDFKFFQLGRDMEKIWLMSLSAMDAPRVLLPRLSEFTELYLGNFSENDKKQNINGYLVSLLWLYNNFYETGWDLAIGCTYPYTLVYL